MGTTYLRLNVVICGVNQINEVIINRLFPQAIKENKRKYEFKDDKILYTARIFRGQATSRNNLSRIIAYLNNNYDHFENITNNYAKTIVLYFSDEEQTLEQNSQAWVKIANTINTLPEVKLPFIIFLSYGEIGRIREQVFRENGDIFGDEFQDKRKITILNLLRNNNNENIEKNYRKILSYLWEMTLILNQESIKPSQNPEANLNLIQKEEPTAAIKILLTGFSRKGKSTFINMTFDKIVAMENPSLLPVTSKIIEFLLPSQHDNNEVVKGGLKIFDVPGLIEGTTDNMKNIENLIKDSIRMQEISHDVINYILFFLCPAPNFKNTSNFLKMLNDSGIKVIFIINRDKPRDNERPNQTKQTLISHLRNRGFNHLLLDNGNNILEVDLIMG